MSTVLLISETGGKDVMYGIPYQRHITSTAVGAQVQIQTGAEAASDG